MDENKKVIILLNSSIEDSTAKLTNHQNFHLNRALRNAGLFHIDLYEDGVIKSLEMPGLRKADTVKKKIRSLISNRADIAWKLEQWSQSGIYIITQIDADYPQKLKDKLSDKAPAVIYGLGNKENLLNDSIAIVGTRDIDEEIKNTTQSIAQKVVENSYSIVSGGAPGVDITAMQAALDHGGVTIGFLKQKFSFKNLSKSGWNRFLEDGSLTLLTEIAPDEKLDRRMVIAAAMNRNKYLFALSQFGIVIAAATKGGTWQGAEEQIKKFHNNVFVVDKEMNAKKGNKELIQKLNALPLPQINDDLIKNMETAYKEWQKNNTTKNIKDKQIELNFD